MHPAFKTLRLPAIAAPLFIISTPKLVIAQCKAGIVGSMPALNARPAELLDEWLAEITETLAAHDRHSRSTRSCTRATRGSSTTWPCARNTRCR
jgi:NAD(P)H-dependent flavin oxidoreductase YrpB (nitropropane dioxygenase family)